MTSAGDRLAGALAVAPKAPAPRLAVALRGRPRIPIQQTATQAQTRNPINTINTIKSTLPKLPSKIPNFHSHAQATALSITPLPSKLGKRSPSGYGGAAASLSAFHWWHSRSSFRVLRQCPPAYEEAARPCCLRNSQPTDSGSCCCPRQNVLRLLQSYPVPKEV